MKKVYKSLDEYLYTCDNPDYCALEYKPNIDEHNFDIFDKVYFTHNGEIQDGYIGMIKIYGDADRQVHIRYRMVKDINKDFFSFNGNQIDCYKSNFDVFKTIEELELSKRHDNLWGKIKGFKRYSYTKGE